MSEMINSTPVPGAPDPSRVQSMFAKVAPKYDEANTVLSMGIHHLWRKKVVAMAQVQNGDQILDCATGTGDLALEFKSANPTASVTGTDFCQEMLDIAPPKAKKRGLDATFLWADAMNLPFPDSSFNVVTISFGIRNVAQPEKALSEMYRVLKPGGRLLVLEFGQPELPGFSQLYRFYSEQILPRIGGWVTGQKDAYQYLQKSSAKFPCGKDFLDLMKRSVPQGAAPFQKTEYRTLSGGIAYLYRGLKSI